METIPHGAKVYLHDVTEMSMITQFVAEYAKSRRKIAYLLE